MSATGLVKENAPRKHNINLKNQNFVEREKIKSDLSRRFGDSYRCPGNLFYIQETTSNFFCRVDISVIGLACQ